MKTTQHTKGTGIGMLELKSQTISVGDFFHGEKGQYFRMGSASRVKDLLLLLPRWLLIRRPEHREAPTFYC